VPASAQGPAIDPAKGYRLQGLGKGLYMITDNAIQSMFLVYNRGRLYLGSVLLNEANPAHRVAETN
jgi:hypothetical protein